MPRGVKELGEAHLSWQSVWELCAQPSELHTSRVVERTERGEKKKIQLENSVIKLLQELAEQHFGLFVSLQTD